MTLAARLKAGEIIFTAWSGIPDSITVETLARTGFDTVTLDMQHGAHHEDSVARGILPILHAEKHAVVRVPVGRFDMASRALDFGAEAVIAPMINSVDDARRFAAAMKYPPVGERSWGPTFGLPRRHKKPELKAWLRGANADTVSFAMIETRRALDALDDILEVPGIDAIFVGPSDFSIAWTDGGEINTSLEDMMPAIERIAKRALDAGKVTGIFAVDPSFAGRYAAMGYRFIALGTEAMYMALGANDLIGRARASIK
ncbi:MAG: HpcH/HpaI aldolase family protein [Rhizobiaceae bacterium]|jgi:4-hydroxy-2-oxoheptanedioate aldolase